MWRGDATSDNSNDPPYCNLRSKTLTMAATSTGAEEASVPSEGPLFLQYPVNSILELTLAPGDETVRGLCYCTDDVSNSVVLKKSLVHTTLASEIRIINADSIKSKKVIMVQAPAATAEDGEAAEELALPLPNVSKKALEEREKKAIRLAEESFSHINEKVSLLYCEGSHDSTVCSWLTVTNSLPLLCVYTIGNSGRTGCL